MVPLLVDTIALCNPSRHVLPLLWMPIALLVLSSQLLGPSVGLPMSCLVLNPMYSARILSEGAYSIALQKPQMLGPLEVS